LASRKGKSRSVTQPASGKDTQIKPNSLYIQPAPSAPALA
jgi:hypothetical protein